MITRKTFSRTNIIATAVSMTAVLLLFLTQADALRRNLTLRYIDRTWNQVQLTGFEIDNSLQDGLPDFWTPRSWNGGQGVVALVEGDLARTGRRAVSIRKTNRQGVAALSQVLAVPDNTLQVTFWVFARGDQGAVQVRFYLEGQGQGQPSQGGWQNISASEEWQRYQVQTAVPAGANRAELLLRSNGLTYFDDAFLWFTQPDGEVNNYALNNEFEIDGQDQPPLEWWAQHAILPDFDPQAGADLALGLPYLNIMDMLNGRYDTISARVGRLEKGCLGSPDMTSWLLNLAPELENQGGLAAREKLYQLAATLAPDCPQPHGQLAQLYERGRAFGAAARQYRIAAELAGNTPLAGYYYYYEGLTHVRNTGDLDLAIEALGRAEQLQGWVTGVVFQGAAAYNLGLALRDAGRLDEAAAAFQRVLDCEGCLNYQKPARAALSTLP